jgi:hypothetical protein
MASQSFLRLYPWPTNTWIMLSFSTITPRTPDALKTASSRQLASCSWIRTRVSATRCCEAIFRVPPKAAIIACESPDARVLPSCSWSKIRSGVSAFQNAFCIVFSMLSSPTRWVSQGKPADALAAQYAPARRFPFLEFAGQGFRSGQARPFELLI